MPKEYFFLKEVNLGQEIIRYLKAIKAADGIMYTHKVQMRFTHLCRGEYSLSLLTAVDNKNNMDAAYAQICDLVSKLSINRFSLAHNYVNLLKGVKNMTVITKLQQVFVQAGWYANDSTAELHICSDTPTNVSKAFTAIQNLIFEQFRLSSRICTQLPPEKPRASMQIIMTAAAQRYLKATYGFKEELENEYNVNIEFNIPKELVIIYGGNKKDKHDAIAKLKSSARNLVKEEVKLMPDLETQLQLVKPWHIVHKLNTLSILAGWNVKNSHLYVCSDSLINVSKAIKTIISTCVQECGPNVFSKPAAMDDVCRQSLTVKEEILRYLKTILEELQLSLQATLYADVEEKCLTVSSYYNQVTNRAVEDLHNIISKQCSASFVKSSAFLSCLKQHQCMLIVEIMREAGVRAGWSLREDRLWLCSNNEDNVQIAKIALEKRIKEVSFPSSNDLIEEELVCSDMFQRKYLKLIEAYNTEDPYLAISFDKQLKKVFIASPKLTVISRVLKDLEKILSECLHETHINLDANELLAFRNLEIIEKMGIDPGDQTLNIVMDAGVLHIYSRSLKCLEATKCKLNALFTNPVQCSVKIEKTALVHYLTTEDGELLLEEIAAHTRTVHNGCELAGGSEKSSTHLQVSHNHD